MNPKHRSDGESTGAYGAAMRLALAATGVALAALVTGCGAAATTGEQPQRSEVVGQPNELTTVVGKPRAAEIAAILTSKGVDCSSFAMSSSGDPGAVDQGHCGFPGVIEIAVFPNHDALAGAFVPFLRDFFCSSSAPLTDSYIDGGAYAIYTDTRTTPLVAAALGIPATKLC